MDIKNEIAKIVQYHRDKHVKSSINDFKDGCYYTCEDAATAIMVKIKEGGFVHLDDVVEGREVCSVEDCGNLAFDKTCPATLCTDAIIYGYKRPATIKDLIGRKDAN